MAVSGAARGEASASSAADATSSPTSNSNPSSSSAVVTWFSTSSVEIRVSGSRRS